MKTESNERGSIVGFDVSGAIPWQMVGWVLKAIHESGGEPTGIKAITNGAGRPDLAMFNGVKALPAPTQNVGTGNTLDIVRARLQSGPATRRELAAEVERAGFSGNSAYYAIDKLVERKVAKKTKPGTYALR